MQHNYVNIRFIYVIILTFNYVGLHHKLIRKTGTYIQLIEINFLKNVFTPDIIKMNQAG